MATSTPDSIGGRRAVAARHRAGDVVQDWRMSSPRFDAAYWRAAWADGRVATIRPPTDRLLEHHWPTLGLPAGSRVLVPLAGTSPDLTWLAGNGFDVVGVELSSIACRAYFEGLGIEPERRDAGPFVRWRGGGVTLLEGDVFDLDGTFDAALDRGALVAFEPQDRPRYAERLTACLAPGAPVLLVTLEYDDGRRGRPPFAVLPDEVERLFPGAVPRTRRRLDSARWDDVGPVFAVAWTWRAPGATLSS